LKQKKKCKKKIKFKVGATFSIKNISKIGKFKNFGGLISRPIYKNFLFFFVFYFISEISPAASSSSIITLTGKKKIFQKRLKTPATSSLPKKQNSNVTTLCNLRTGRKIDKLYPN